MAKSKGLAALLKTDNRVTKEGKNELPVETQFLNEFNETLIKVEKEREQDDPPDGYFRPSSLHGCERMLWFAQTGADKDTEKASPTLIGICESGTDRHARIQYIVSRMKDFGFNCETLDVEQEVEKAKARGIETEFIGWNEDKTEARCRNDEYRIFFQPDGVLLYKGRKYLLEIKTETSFTFSKRFAPKDEHLNFQATCYAAGMGINNVLFFYEDRNFTEKKPFVVTVTEEMKKRVKDKVFRVLWYVKNNVPPPKEADKCQYCKYKSACKKLGETDAVYVG